MPELTPSVLVSFLKTFVSAVRKQALRLHKEREAGRMPSVDSDLMENVLDRTLDRLRGGDVDESWWRAILNQFGQMYVAPDALKKPTLQEWLADRHVSDDLKDLAKATLMGGDVSDSDVRDRLARNYSDRTGEAVQSANGPIEIVVAILVAGYIASIPSDQHPVISMLQEFSGRFNERLDRWEQVNLPALKDPITQQSHTERAEQELSNILRLRVFDSVGSRRIQDLLGRLRDGDLTAASAPVKTRVCYWTARLCASQTETALLAKQLRNDLQVGNPSMDLVAVDALIAESDDDIEKAFRLLRDREDSDSRSVFFSLLSRSKGEEAALSWFRQQVNHDDPQFFEPIGWVAWAICMAKLKNWGEASKCLITLQDRWDEMPALAYVEGCINAAMIVPPEWRQGVLSGSPPLFGGMAPNQGAVAKSHHSRAKICFKFLEQCLRDAAVQGLGEVIAVWNLWLRLMEPKAENVNIARNEIGQRMDQGSRAVDLIPFAHAFAIPFDAEPLRDYLEQRKTLGGLDGRELFAECLLFKRSLSPRDFVDYLDQNRTRLTKVVSPEHLSAMHVDALVEDGQSERAKEVAEEYRNGFDEIHFRRLALLIDADKGRDVRERLEGLYHETGSVGDLRNLVSYLKSIGDQAALRPLVRELFNQARTTEHAFDVVRSLGGPFSFDPEAIVEFLDENADLLEQNRELKTAKVFALFHIGRFKGAREINDDLLNQKASQENLGLAFKIAISSGDWERMGGILDRAWDHRNSHDPDSLMGLAHLVGGEDYVSERVLKLSRLAVEKAPDDPRILSAAYWLHFRLGHEAEAEQDWLAKAFELSSAEAGPLWGVSLQDLVTDWLPRRRAHLQEVERKWLAGELPMSLAAGQYNLSLARLLLHVSDQNAIQSDGRRRTILPIMVGGRKSVEFQATWTIGLDVTTVMVLFYLGLLEKALDSFCHVKLAHNIMGHLFQERSEARFHQPSRIEAAKQVLALQSKNLLQVVDVPAASPKIVADEVGVELAALFQAAEAEKGKVVCALPIHKVGSLMEQQADTSAYNDFILPVMDFCRLLHDEGKIVVEDYQRARSFLNSQGQVESADPSSCILDGPIYVDGLALSYLLDARMLQPIAAGGVSIRVHPRVVEEMDALIHEGDTGQNLIGKIEAIRHVLRNAVDSGKASFLPYVPDWNEEIQEDNINLINSEIRAMASLLTGSAGCDAVCIDDRFVNRHLHVAEQEAPIGCVLDILRYLVAVGSISETDYWSARHKLRQGGFGLVPLESDELVYWLKLCRISDGDLTENMGLRILRQTVARGGSLAPTNQEEVVASVENFRISCNRAILEIWESQDLSPEKAAIFSSWIWRRLMIGATIPGYQTLPWDVHVNLIQEWVALRLGILLLSIPTQSQERHACYVDWIEGFLLQSLCPANADRIERALDFTRKVISELDVGQTAYGNFFLRRLPEAARKVAIDLDPEFARKCGYGTEPVFSVGSGVQLTVAQLHGAVREVFATKRERALQDVAGNEVWISLDAENRNIILKWRDEENGYSQADISDLAMLSPDREVRLAALRDVIGRLGPTAVDLSHLLDDVQSREPSHQELATIFDECANGVMAVQDSLVRKTNHGLPISVADVAPQSISYFERFAGPNPGDQEPETYLHEALVPYRRELLRRDLGKGLDICCLGALRDDLTPGQWVSGHNDDAIWDALSSCHAKSNPFSLLGALDIALYRLEDRRFEEFAAEAVAQLSDENFGQQGAPDIYGLLQICANFVFNRISLLENGSTYPGYWKRMSAWMQGGLITRSIMAESTFSTDDLDMFQTWVQSNMVAAGAYAELVDARREPMVFAGRLRTSLALRLEIVERLRILRIRHEGEGRRVPRSEHIDRALDRVTTDGLAFALGFPGPLEGHKRPTVPVPQDVGRTLEQLAVENIEPSSLEPFVTASQFFALGAPELECVRKAVQTITESVQHHSRSTLMHLGSASLVASANHHTMLADDIAEAVVKISTNVSEEEIQMILTIMFQAAAAYEARDEWFKWLEEKLTDIANCLPAPPNKALLTLLAHLDEIEKILPIESWFHSRARIVALAGAA